MTFCKIWFEGNFLFGDSCCKTCRGGFLFWWKILSSPLMERIASWKVIIQAKRCLVYYIEKKKVTTRRLWYIKLVGSLMSSFAQFCSSFWVHRLLPQDAFSSPFLHQAIEGFCLLFFVAEYVWTSPFTLAPRLLHPWSQFVEPNFTSSWILLNNLYWVGLQYSTSFHLSSSFCGVTISSSSCENLNLKCDSSVIRSNLMRSAYHEF
jgi:hypothetical protein